MASLGNASSVPSEQGARDDVDETSGDQPGGVPGEARVLGGVEVPFCFEEEGLDVGDEFLSFFVGDVHTERAEAGFNLLRRPRFGVDDRVFERVDASEAVALRLTVGAAVAADEAVVRSVGRDAVQGIRQVRQHSIVG